MRNILITAKKSVRLEVRLPKYEENLLNWMSTAAYRNRTEKATRFMIINVDRILLNNKENIYRSCYDIFL